MKTNRLIPWLCAAMAVGLCVSACNKETSDVNEGGQQGETKPVVTPPKPITYLQFNPEGANDLTFEYDKASGVSTITTTGNDPYIRLEAFKKAVPADSCVLSFEYSTNSGLTDNIQLFFGPPEAQERSCFTGQLPKTGASWSKIEYNLKDQRTDYSWGGAGDWLRIDFGNNPGIKIRLRNIYFRGMTPEEKAADQEKTERLADHARLAAELERYLSTSYPSKVTYVEVQEHKVVVKGECSGEGSFMLSEITPWMDVTRTQTHDLTVALDKASFTVELDRYVTIGEYKYDRVLSKWAILKAGADAPELVSHARYADEVVPVSSPEAFPFPTKKGTAGVGILNYSENDIKDLGATSATMNMNLNEYLAQGAAYGTHEEFFAGQGYYFNDNAITTRDNILYQYSREGTVPIGIVLIPTGSIATDPSARLLSHPECAGGYYAMPDMTTPKGVLSYAAVMKMLTSRYNGLNNAGRIAHWIMHNEIDAAMTWTNMGDKQEQLFFMDTYIKSMRLVYNILRQYDQHAWVLASFTHCWTRVDEDYQVVSQLGNLLDFTAAEGDFRWGLAMHPYPKNLTRPAFWVDDRELTASMDVSYVTFYNLEVYDKWIRQKDHFYKGDEKRLLILSENGTSTPTYEESDQQLQAAGACWVWKKVKALDGIDAIQWHSWVDNEIEFGLRLGFRKYGTDPDDPYGKKKSWYVWQAAGTDKEDEVFEPYKAIIGINDWDEIFLK